MDELPDLTRHIIHPQPPGRIAQSKTVSPTARQTKNKIGTKGFTNGYKENISGGDDLPVITGNYEGMGVKSLLVNSNFIELEDLRQSLTEIKQILQKINSNNNNDTKLKIL